PQTPPRRARGAREVHLRVLHSAALQPDGEAPVPCGRTRRGACPAHKTDKQTLDPTAEDAHAWFDCADDSREPEPRPQAAWAAPGRALGGGVACRARGGSRSVASRPR